VKYAADELLTTDRAVRATLQVRDGQTIADRAREVLIKGGPGRELLNELAVAVVATPGWYGVKAAFDILRTTVHVVDLGTGKTVRRERMTTTQADELQRNTLTIELGT
jgi:hypothetical protein